MFYLGLISFAASMLVMLIALILTIFQLIKRQTLLTKSTITLASVSFGLHTLSILTLMAMQVLQDSPISYVVSGVNSVMPPILKMTPGWGGQAGSLFFWGWTLNLVLFISLHVRRQIQDGWSFLFTALNLLFFGALSLFAENPFSRVWLTEAGNILEGVFSPAAAQLLWRLLVLGESSPAPLGHGDPSAHSLPRVCALPGAFLRCHFLPHQGETEEGLLGETRLWLLSAWILRPLVSCGSCVLRRVGMGGYWAWDPLRQPLSSLAHQHRLLHSLLLQKAAENLQTL
jgi:cytochrome c-type biogenesis protein CcmF